MERTKIKAGHWYETTQGIGECIKAGGCHPWAALINIVGPIPRGERWVSPRDVISEHKEIPGRVERALRRFGQHDEMDSTMSPAQDHDMMAAVDFARYVVGTTLPGGGHWRWTLTERGKKARASLDPLSTIVDAVNDAASRLMNKNRWHSMYLGALAALIVPNVMMAKEMAELTASDEECISAIRIMREAREGDRTWPALEYLRGLRKGGKEAVP